jgi:acyl-CoA synthetase (AMP-forming)/AMP-acid ligase II/thioesterase domain-containing protein
MEMNGSLGLEIRRNTLADPAAPALLAPGMPALTRGELLAQVDGIAFALTSAGLRRGAVVAVVEPGGAELLSLFLGISAIGACAPLNPALSPSELEFYMPDLRPDALVVNRLDSPAAAQARMQDLPIFETHRLISHAALVTQPPPSPEPDAEALLLHTSATTGRAKLVPLTHRRLNAMMDNAARILELSGRDRFLSMMPLFHLQGLISAAAQLARGGSVIAAPGFDAVRFPEWMEEFRPTWYTAGPALHGAILPVARKEQSRVRSAPLRFVRSIGARLPPQLLADVETALGVPVLEGYGLTETGVVTSNPLPPGLRKPGSAGPANGSEISILDENGAPVEPGRQGQIAVRGPAVFDGYRHNEEVTRLAFRDGWFLTGDLGRLDEDGYLFISGRLKEMINRGGEKVLPVEVDDVLMSHPAVARAAAFAMPHPTLGEDVAAAVVVREGAGVSESALRRYAAAHLAPFKIPRRILFLDSLPAGATGKPKRAELAARLADAVRPFHPPESDIELRLAAIWQRLLNLDQVGRHDDFFSLGGDSFALTLFMTELEIEFGAAANALDESEFFASPDLATIARMLEGHAPQRGSAPLVQRPPYIVLQREGKRRPIFCIPGADENPYYFRELAQCLGGERPFYVLRDPRPLEARGRYSVEEVAARYAGIIRSLQSEGPYLLGGHCFGGVVAYEAARQLRRQGARVDHVVLFEVPAPGHPKIARHWWRYARAAGEVLLGRRNLTLSEAAAHLKTLARLARRRLPAPVAAPPPATHPNVEAMQSYVPRPLDCPVTQFIAAAEPHKSEILDDPLLAWREYVDGNFDVQPAAGPADAIFRYPHVRTLAENLRRVLDSHGESSR